jgi:hypothetical protein
MAQGSVCCSSACVDSEQDAHAPLLTELWLGEMLLHIA